jgi:hypothetical protein
MKPGKAFIRFHLPLQEAEINVRRGKCSRGRLSIASIYLSRKGKQMQGEVNAYGEGFHPLPFTSPGSKNKHKVR